MTRVAQELPSVRVQTPAGPGRIAQGTASIRFAAALAALMAISSPSPASGRTGSPDPNGPVKANRPPPGKESVVRAQPGELRPADRAAGQPQPASVTSTAAGAPAPAPLPNGPIGPAGPSGGMLPGPVVPTPKPPVVARLGRFDLDLPLAQLAQLPEMKACAAQLATPMGHADCALPPNEEKVARLNLAWDDSRPGGELLALRLAFDAQLAPPLTELEWQLTRAWGAPMLEQLRREKDQKVFTLQWEDAEHRATLEAAGPIWQPARAVAVWIERKPHPLGGELATLRPRPFPGMRSRLVRKLEWEGALYAFVWGTSLSPVQEALGEASPAWAGQRSYAGLFRFEVLANGRRRWRQLWERICGDDEDNDLQRIVGVESRDLTGDNEPDLLLLLTCPTCAGSTSEVVVKTIRGGKVVDLFGRRDLFRAEVTASVGQLRIREREGEDGATVSTYDYDRRKGAFVLSHEERTGVAPGAPGTLGTEEK